MFWTAIAALAAVHSASAKEFHFVAFSFKQDVTAAEQSQVMTMFGHLKDLCRKEGVNFDITMGTNNSKQEKNQGYSQGFLAEFPSEKMRDRYVGCLDRPCQEGGTEPAVGHCKAHDDFKVLVGPLLGAEQAPSNYNAGMFIFDYILPRRDGVVHAVFFRYAPTTIADQKDQIRSRFLGLVDLCPGVQSIVSGDQNSKEGVDQLYEHGYVVSFVSAIARDFYVGCLDKPCQRGGTQPPHGWCKAHDDFKIFVGDFLGGNAPAQLDKPDSVGHYNPGVLVFDFKSLDLLV